MKTFLSLWDLCSSSCSHCSRAPTCVGCSPDLTELGRAPPRPPYLSPVLLLSLPECCDHLPCQPDFPAQRKCLRDSMSPLATGTEEV